MMNDLKNTDAKADYFTKQIYPSKLIGKDIFSMIITD